MCMTITVNTLYYYYDYYYNIKYNSYFTFTLGFSAIFQHQWHKQEFGLSQKKTLQFAYAFL